MKNMFSEKNNVKQETEEPAVQAAAFNAIQTAGRDSTQTADNASTQTAGDGSTQTAGHGSTQQALGEHQHESQARQQLPPKRRAD